MSDAKSVQYVKRMLPLFRAVILRIVTRLKLFYESFRNVICTVKLTVYYSLFIEIFTAGKNPGKGGVLVQN